MLRSLWWLPFLLQAQEGEVQEGQAPLLCSRSHLCGSRPFVRSPGSHVCGPGSDLLCSGSRGGLLCSCPDVCRSGSVVCCPGG